MILKPTHTCFDDAFLLMLELSKLCPWFDKDTRLVHAICISSEGHKYVHGFVKIIDKCFFDVITQDDQQVHCAVDTEQYLSSLNITYKREYPINQVIALAILDGYKAGPWDKEISKLCIDNANSDLPKQVGAMHNVKVTMFKL